MQTNDTNLEAVVRAGRHCTEAQKRIAVLQTTDSELPLVYRSSINGEATLDTVAMGRLDGGRRHPHRCIGEVTFHDARSLVAYLKRYRTDEMTLWCNVGSAEKDAQIIAVLDDHGAVDGEVVPGHRAWIAVYKPRASQAWNAWSAILGRKLSQEALADHIEEHVSDVTSEGDAGDAAMGEKLPTGIELLQLARSLQIYSTGTYKKDINPQTGEFALVCQQEHQSGSTVIPPTFAVRLPVFEGDAAYQVLLRLTFKLEAGVPKFVIKMRRQNEFLLDAIQQIGAGVGKELGVTPYMGIP